MDYYLVLKSVQTYYYITLYFNHFYLFRKILNQFKINLSNRLIDKKQPGMILIHLFIYSN